MVYVKRLDDLGEDQFVRLPNKHDLGIHQGLALKERILEAEAICTLSFRSLSMTLLKILHVFSQPSERN